MVGAFVGVVVWCVNEQWVIGWEHCFGVECCCYWNRQFLGQGDQFVACIGGGHFIIGDDYWFVRLVEHIQCGGDVVGVCYWSKRWYLFELFFYDDICVELVVGNYYVGDVF